MSRLPVSASSISIKNCSKCNGTNSIECVQCFGRGKLYCSYCRGHGYRTRQCYMCNGRGKRIFRRKRGKEEEGQVRVRIVMGMVM